MKNDTDYTEAGADYYESRDQRNYERRWIPARLVGQRPEGIAEPCAYRAPDRDLA
jgi:hypothetical protein